LINGGDLLLSLSWVNAQIESAMNGNNTPQNVRDYALLCIARDNLQKITPDQDNKTTASVRIADHSADINYVPTIGEIEKAMAAVAENNAEDHQRMNDLRTWTDIMKN